MEQSAEDNNINSETSTSKSDEASRDDGGDEKGSDDIQLSKLSPDDKQRAKSSTPKRSISGFETPSTSTDSHTSTRDLSRLPVTLKVSKKTKRLGMEAPTETRVDGVKRKFLGDQNDVKKRKRHKASQPKNTVQTKGKKRKVTPDNTALIAKRPKPAFENDPAAKKKSDIAQNISASESETSPNNEVVEDSDDDPSELEPCTSSCVCKAGPSKLPLEVERKFDTPEPLYRSCLLRRMYSLANTQYICCEKRCVKKHSREKILKECLFYMNEDYYRSDMALHQYKWGEWKE